MPSTFQEQSGSKCVVGAETGSKEQSKVAKRAGEGLGRSPGVLKVTVRTFPPILSGESMGEKHKCTVQGWGSQSFPQTLEGVQTAPPPTPP